MFWLKFIDTGKKIRSDKGIPACLYLLVLSTAVSLAASKRVPCFVVVAKSSAQWEWEW